MGTGRNKRIDPLERVLNLFTLLHRANAPLTREEIVNEMARGMTPYPVSADAQRQLFASDKNTIVRDLGIPIRQIYAHGDEAGQTRYWITHEDMSIPEIDLDADEMAVLSLALASIHHSVPEASEAMMKFEGEFPRRSGFDFYVDLPAIVVTLAEAIQHRHVVNVTFESRSIAIEPMRLVFDKGTWYVIAVVHGSNSPTAFRCSRLGDARVVEGSRSTLVRESFDEASLRSLVHEAQGDPIEATVVLDAHGARLPWWDWRVKETVAVEDPTGVTTGLKLTVEVDDLARFRGWLFGFADHAVVESPLHLRTDVVSWIDATIADLSTPSSVSVELPEPRHARPGPRPIGERLQRLLSILPWLRLSGSIQVEQLAAMLGVAPESLMKDLEFASMCGVPPYTHDALFDFSVVDSMVIVHAPDDTFAGAGTTTRKTRHLMTRPVKLTPRQATAVAVALAGLEAVTGDLGTHNEAVETLRSKLAVVLGSLPVQVRLDAVPFLAEIQRMIDESRRIRMTYVDASGRITERLVDPLHVFVERGESYVIADDVPLGTTPDGTSEERLGWTFRIDQIIDIEPTDVIFESREVSFAGWTFRGDIVESVVSLAAGNEWVVDRIHARAHRTEPDGSITLWITVASEWWLAKLLLRCGAGSRVVAPGDLNSRVGRLIDSVRYLYD